MLSDGGGEELVTPRLPGKKKRGTSLISSVLDEKKKAPEIEEGGERGLISLA